MIWWTSVVPTVVDRCLVVVGGASGGGTLEEALGDLCLPCYPSPYQRGEGWGGGLHYYYRQGGGTVIVLLFPGGQD